MSNPEQKLAKWERVVFSIGTPILTAAILFAASQLWAFNQNIAETNVKLQYLNDTVSELKRKVDEVAYNYVQRQEFKDLDDRVRSLERGRR
jgi:hypothetical protein